MVLPQLLKVFLSVMNLMLVCLLIHVLFIDSNSLFKITCHFSLLSMEMHNDLISVVNCVK